MSLFDFVFPEQAQASHLRDLAESGRDVASAMRAKEVEELGNRAKLGVLLRRVERLENDMALSSMINALLIRKYIADTGKNLEQLRAEMAEVDRSDGVVDGGFDTGELRRLLGLPLAEIDPPVEQRQCRDCGRKVITQHQHCLYCGGPVIG
jgi:hypothetical protein